jgi:hypothetical protein
MDATVATGAAAMMAIRVLLDHDVKEENINLVISKEFFSTYLVIPVYNDHPHDPKIVAVVDRWSLFGGHLCYKRSY